MGYASRPIRPEGAFMTPPTHRGWAIRYDPPPVPYRDADWIATPPDDDGLCLRGATRGDVVRQIEEMCDANAD